MSKKPQTIKKIVNLAKYNNKLKKEINEIDDIKHKINKIEREYERNSSD